MSVNAIVQLVALLHNTWQPCLRLLRFLLLADVGVYSWYRLTWKIQVMTQQSNTRIEKNNNVSQNDFQITYNKVLKQKLNNFQRFDAANQSSSLSDMLKSCLKTANFALFLQ